MPIPSQRGPTLPAIQHDAARCCGLLVELREVVEQDEPDTGEVVRRTGRLRSAIGKLGDAGATAATSRAAEALTDMAMNGQFF